MKTHIKYIIRTALLFILYTVFSTIAYADNGKHPCEHKGWQEVIINNYSTEDAIFVHLQFPYTFVDKRQGKSNRLIMEYYDFSNKSVEDGIINTVAKYFQPSLGLGETPPLPLVASIKVEKRIVDENTYDEGDVTPKKIKACVLTDIKNIHNKATPQQIKFFKFSDYPAKVIKITPENRHPAIIAEEDKDNDKMTELLQWLEKEDVNFAGHYVIGGTSCGSGGCMSRVVLDLTTGKTIDSFGSTACYSLEPNSDPVNHVFSRPDSRLVAVVGDFDEGECTLNYYVEENGQLKNLHSEPWNKRNIEDLKKQLNGDSPKTFCFVYNDMFFRTQSTNGVIL